MNIKDTQLAEIAHTIKTTGQALGFQQIGITDTDLTSYEKRFQIWLAQQKHGTMDYLEKHGSKRFRPAELVPGTARIISARMDYLPPSTKRLEVLNNPHKGYISRYALGRDYHRLIRKRLAQLAEIVSKQVDHLGFRVFCDSAPVLEKPIAEKAGLGWIGKHTNLINSKAGSWFFLGEIYTDLPLPLDHPQTQSHCGSCTACIDICPTQAITAPYQLDARRCISYLTIELKEAIPESLRPLIGNRIYGCDDCQLVCPWNKFARTTQEDAFHARKGLSAPDLLDLFAWDEATFLEKTAGSAIRRIGHQRWLRNIAVGLGNAPQDRAILQALQEKMDTASSNALSPMVQEHIAWAIKQQMASTLPSRQK